MLLHPELKDLLNSGIPLLCDRIGDRIIGDQTSLLGIIDTDNINCDIVKLPEVISDWDRDAKAVYIANLIVEEIMGRMGNMFNLVKSKASESVDSPISKYGIILIGNKGFLTDETPSGDSELLVPVSPIGSAWIDSWTQSRFNLTNSNTTDYWVQYGDGNSIRVYSSPTASL